MVVSLYLNLPFSSTTKPFYALNLNWFIPFLSLPAGEEAVVCLSPLLPLRPPQLRKGAIYSNEIEPATAGKDGNGKVPSLDPTKSNAKMLPRGNENEILCLRRVLAKRGP